MAPKTYDVTCLTVWPEWGSSGIWHPEQRGINGPVRMVGFDHIGLPADISQRFKAWIERYDEYSPDRPNEYDWESFDAEGKCLAQELANAMRGRFVVEYKLQLIQPCC